MNKKNLIFFALISSLASIMQFNATCNCTHNRQICNINIQEKRMESPKVRNIDGSTTQKITTEQRIETRTINEQVGHHHHHHASQQDLGTAIAENTKVAAEYVKEKGGQALEKVKEVTHRVAENPTVQRAKEKVGEFKETVQEKLASAADAIQEGIHTTKNKAIEVKNRMVNKASQAQETIEEDAKVVRTAAANTVGAVADTAKKIAQDVSKDLKEGTQEVKQGIKEARNNPR